MDKLTGVYPMIGRPLIEIRASSMSTLLDCALRFYYTQIIKLSMPTSAPAHIGRCVHRSAAVFDKGVLNSAPVSVTDSAGVFVDALNRPEEDVVWGDMNKRQAEAIGLRLHTGYCMEVAPTREYTHVENYMGKLDVETEDATVRLSGTPDRIRRFEDGFAVSDIKTGKRCVSKDGNAITKTHGAQLGIYELLAEQNEKLQITGPAEVIGLQTTVTPKRGLGYMDSPRKKLIGDGQSPGLIEIAAKMMRHGIFPPNPQSFICHPTYCPARRENGGPCIYHE